MDNITLVFMTLAMILSIITAVLMAMYSKTDNESAKLAANITSSSSLGVFALLLIGLSIKYFLNR
jgi:hypothetical protein